VIVVVAVYVPGTTVKFMAFRCAIRESVVPVVGVGATLPKPGIGLTLVGLAGRDIQLPPLSAENCRAVRKLLMEEVSRPALPALAAEPVTLHAAEAFHIPLDLTVHSTVWRSLPAVS
jgi:hypothetical protein